MNCCNWIDSNDGKWGIIRISIPLSIPGCLRKINTVWFNPPLKTNREIMITNIVQCGHVRQTSFNNCGSKTSITGFVLIHHRAYTEVIILYIRFSNRHIQWRMNRLISFSKRSPLCAVIVGETKFTIVDTGHRRIYLQRRGIELWKMYILSMD